MLWIFSRRKERVRDLAAAAARIAEPASKPATARALSLETAAGSLGKLPGLVHATGDEMPGMLDWLLRRQPWVEKSLARRHLTGGTLILYDL